MTARVVLAGALMGWANLVPGVSGGTMLLACGVYPAFIAAVTDLTLLRVRRNAVLFVLALAAGGAAAVVSSAGVIRELVVSQPVVMYSLFTGLTLGGVPLVLRRARPIRAPGWTAGVLAFFGLLALAWLRAGDASTSGPVLAFVAGVVGASAMVLPGLSGSYLLLLMGQYLPILGAIEGARVALLDPLLGGAAPDLAAGAEALWVLLPFAVGVGLGVVAVSHGVRAALERAPGATYGFLLGLLVGAVPGLWPFGEGRGDLTVGTLGLAVLSLAAGAAVTTALCRLEAVEVAPHP